jgi:tetratricopeptide (TPR) repeat protein
MLRSRFEMALRGRNAISNFGGVMPNVRFAGPRSIAGLLVTLTYRQKLSYVQKVCAISCLLSSALFAQVPFAQPREFGNPYDASLASRGSFSPWGVDYPPPTPPPGPPVSADFLRHPLSSRARKVLEKAARIGELGNHLAALSHLRQALEKFPSAAPYVHNLMGVEFVSLGQFSAAKEAFRRVLDVMPHISANHANYGLALTALGENMKAEEEFRTALVLDDQNERARALLDDLHTRLAAVGLKR